jgi:hypothetical protein
MYAMKAYKGVGVLLHALSALTLGGHRLHKAALPERKTLLMPPEQPPEWATL